MVTTTAPVTAAARYVGQSVRRKEDGRLVTGHGEYLDDVAMPGMLHAAFLRSDVARARITRLDISAAVEAEGVCGVFTGPDLNRDEGPAWHAMLGDLGLWPFRALADGDVRFVGDPIVLVVATSRYLAEDACELVEVEYEVLDAVVDYRTAVADTAHVVHAEKESNAMVAVPFMALAADLDEVFARAAHVVEATIDQHRYVCVPMEGRGILASWHEGRDEMDIVMSTQSVHETRNYFARYLDVPESKITVSMRDVGGAFGQKMFAGREESAVALASRRLRKPVKWVEDRRENLISAGHSRNECGKVRMALDADGVIEAITVEHVADVGAYVVCPAVMDPTLLTGPYRIPRLGFSTTMAFTNTMGKTAYRGPWMFETTAREMMMDLAARQLGLEPIELRRRNIIRSEELPWTNPAGKVFDEVTPAESLEQAVEMLGYDDFRAEQASARSEGRFLGLGVCVYIEPSSMDSPTLHTEAARVVVESSGRISVFMGTSSHGQSVETTMAQVVADNLGVDVDDVTIIQGDTRSTPYGPGTGGSRTAVVAGGAARQAAQKVKEMALDLAALSMEAAPEDLEIASGVISVRGTPTRSITLKEVAELAYVNPGALRLESDAGLEATVRFRPSRLPTWSNAAHLCVVEINEADWLPRVVRYIVSEDCGRMINPMVVEGQIFGGVVQGIGGVLLEDFVYDEAGMPLTTTFMDYLLPTTTEIPNIEVGHIASVSTTNPGGFKGMGEGGAIGAHAAVANAVGDALAHLGVRVTSTPLGPNDIFALVEAAKQRA
jgi:carbon-monoxide dehydrogenase large subunit